MEISESKLKELRNSGQALWSMHFGEKASLLNFMDYISSVSRDLPLVDYLITNRFHHSSTENSVRAEWKSAIYYTIQRLLECDDARAVTFIDLFAEQLSFLKFVSSLQSKENRSSSTYSSN